MTNETSARVRHARSAESLLAAVPPACVILGLATLAWLPVIAAGWFIWNLAP